jgi:hypothetical protein
MVTAITVTGTWTRPDGSQAPASGGVTFQLAHPITDPGGNVIVAAQTVSADLDANGSISVDLAATDEPGTSPRGNTYYVIESIEGQPRRTYSIEVPHDATNGRVDLADVAPAYERDLATAGGGVPDPHDLLSQSHSNLNVYRRDDTPIVLGTADMAVVRGSPSVRQVSGRWTAYSFNDTNAARIAGVAVVPYQWDAVDIGLWYTTQSGNSGDVVIRDRRLSPQEGDDLSQESSADTVLSVSVASEHLATATLTTDAPVSDTDSHPVGPGPLLLSFERRPGEASDTLNGDFLFLAYVLSKAG